MRVVLATIDRNIEETLRKKFSERSIDFFSVQRGLDAVTDLLDHDSDLLIVDMDLYGNVSVDLLPLIRKLRPRLPIVLIADDLTQCVRRIAAEQGVTFQTDKPHNLEELLRIVDATEKIIAKRHLLSVN